MDSLSGDVVQDFFFVPDECDASLVPHTKDSANQPFVWMDAIEGLDKRNQNLFIYAFIS